MKRKMLTEPQLKSISRLLSSYSIYCPDDIFRVIIQTKSIDATISILFHCAENFISLNEGVYLFLKHKDLEHERM